MKNYINDVSIDDSALDVELLELPKLVLQYAENCAAAKNKMDVLKDELDLKRAELDKKVRRKPSLLGDVKPTEASYASYVESHPEYQDVVDRHNDARFEYETAKGAVAAIETKKESLRLLVSLYGQNYFAGPSVPRDLSVEAARKRRDTDVQSRIADKMSRTKR